MAKTTTKDEVAEISTEELMAPETRTDMVQYELTYLLVPTVNDVEQSSVSEHIRKIIEKMKGKIADESVWGKQKLSYEIGGHSMGVYVVLKIQLLPSEVVNLEKELKLVEPVLRFLLIRKDSEKVRRLQEERDNKREAGRRAAESKTSPIEEDMEVLTAEKAAEIKEEIKKEMKEKKITDKEKLKEIDERLDQILDEDIEKTEDEEKL